MLSDRLMTASDPYLNCESSEIWCSNCGHIRLLLNRGYIFWKDFIFYRLDKPEWAITQVLCRFPFSPRHHVLAEQQGYGMLPGVSHQPVHGLRWNLFAAGSRRNNLLAFPLFAQHDDGAALVRSHVFRNCARLRQPRAPETYARNLRPGFVNGAALLRAVLAGFAGVHANLSGREPALATGSTWKTLSGCHGATIDEVEAVAK